MYRSKLSSPKKVQIRKNDTQKSIIFASTKIDIPEQKKNEFSLVCVKRIQMASYAEVLSAIDSDVIASLDEKLIFKLIALLNREHAKRRTKSPVSWLNEWVIANPMRNVTYSLSQDMGNILIVDEHGKSWSADLPREPLLIGRGKEIQKHNRQILREIKARLAGFAMLYIKTMLS